MNRALEDVDSGRGVADLGFASGLVSGDVGRLVVDAWLAERVVGDTKQIPVEGQRSAGNRKTDHRQSKRDQR